MTAVIADDITGAAEVAGVCMRKGVSVRLLVGVPAPEALGGAEVLVIATNTRSGSREEACTTMEALSERLRQAGITEVFKKTDSALRGWVLAEMGTLARAFGRKRLLIQPANLETGRTLRSGIYYVRGVPLAQTPFRDDPAFPATSSDAAVLLRLRDGAGMGKGLPVKPGVTVSRPEVTDSQPEVTVVLPDATVPEDLAASAVQCGPEDLPGGSAAFWGYWMERHIGQGTPGQAGSDGPSVMPGPDRASLDISHALVICGSAHPASHAWCRERADDGFPTREIPEALCSSEEEGSPLERKWIRQCIAAWRENGRLLIRSAENPVVVPGDPGRPGRRLAACAAQILSATRPDNVLIEGGETAWEILQRLGWTGFTPVKEWSPGVVSLRLDRAPHCTVTLKPGSYAWPNINQL